MKTFKLLLIVIMLSILTTTQAQGVLKFRTTAFTFSILDDAGNWGEWESWSPTSNLVTLDEVQEKLTVYTKKNQPYDIVSCSKVYEDSDGDTRFNLTCVDEEGVNCELVILKFSGSGQMRLYINYSNANIIYEIDML